MFRVYYIVTFPLTLVCLGAIRFYQLLVSRALPKSCHFLPTCSHYAFDSIREFGCIWGGIYAAKRLARCNPRGKGGYDFVKLNLLGNYKWKC